MCLIFVLCIDERHLSIGDQQMEKWTEWSAKLATYSQMLVILPQGDLEIRLLPKNLYWVSDLQGIGFWLQVSKDR